MARPIKVFTEDEAQHLIRYLVKKANVGGYGYSRNMLIEPGDGHEATPALDALTKLQPADAPGEVRSWIDTYLSDAGWTRIQAAMRQNKAAFKNHRARMASDGGKREVITKISTDADWEFGEYAKLAKLPKKDYISLLAKWLTKTDSGCKAHKQFFAYAELEAKIKAGQKVIDKDKKYTAANAAKRELLTKTPKPKFSTQAQLEL